MSDAMKISFGNLDGLKGGDVVVFVGEDLKSSSAVAKILGSKTTELIAKAAKIENFKGKMRSSMAIVAPGSLAVDRLIVVGIGSKEDRGKLNAIQLGGALFDKAVGKAVTVLADLPGLATGAEMVADLALGAALRGYRFKRYKTKNDDTSESARVTFLTKDLAGTRRAFKASSAVADGVLLARDLVNEPANVLGPVEFAQRAQTLSKLGIAVEILDEKALRKLGMRALLGVGQGSVRESRVAIMRWNGGRAGVAPLAVVGKGVVFDSGGISIKPGAGMEDMKGDMAGAACVVGLMQALAVRGAKANVVGLIGLVENMPDGNAQRPGDIVTTMSGQTIEIINTDAEGRLVLADVLWYAQQRFKPKAIIDLATLTGAIMVSLGHEYAGLFSNDDELAQRLTAAGAATGERLWRMPLGPEFDKMIESRFADMKNTGGRLGGASTAAALLGKFVNNVPWAHLDIAGTAMSSPQTDTNKSWASGWGVRLLDRLVVDHFEG